MSIFASEKAWFSEVQYSIFSQTETERNQKLRFIAHNKYIEVFPLSFFSFSISYIRVVIARSSALKIQQKDTNLLPWQQQSQ